MKRIFFGIALFTISVSAYSQAVFLRSGKIEFERKTNTHRLYFDKSDDNDSWSENFKKMVSQFKTNYFDLTFTEGKSVYRPGKEVDEKNAGFFQNPADQNVVYRDLAQGTSISQKRIFEAQFLLTDSAKKLVWKFDGETRTIAGFECKKAVTRIFDSVVVVAFYTEEILPSDGPESFGGLPGMILGLAIPRLYTTWFATKVETISDADLKKMTPPTKGKKASETEMLATIKDAIKEWGDKYYHRAMWFSGL